MPVLVTSNFDDDSIKNEWTSMKTPFSHYKSMGNFLDLKGSLLRSQWSDLAEIRTHPRFYACPCYLQVKKDRIKNNWEKVETSFSPLSVNGGFLLPWKPEFGSILPQILMQPFPYPIDATHKIWSRLANWLQRYSSLKVWMTTTDDGW